VAEINEGGMGKIKPGISIPLSQPSLSGEDVDS